MGTITQPTAPTADKFDRVWASLPSADRVVLVGGSYIACEVAASLTARYFLPLVYRSIETRPRSRQLDPHPVPVVDMLLHLSSSEQTMC